jgi:hypothetical protein
MGLFDRFKMGGRRKPHVKRDGGSDFREIVVLLARCAGTFSTCADTISRTGKAFNPNYETVSTGLGLVCEHVQPLAERLIRFATGLDRGELDISALGETEIQFCITLGSELRHVTETLARSLGTERVYQALRTNAPSKLWQLAQNLRQLEAVAALAGKLHLADLDESGAAREAVLEQLREFVSPNLIDEWASLGPRLRRPID